MVNHTCGPGGLGRIPAKLPAIYFVVNVESFPPYKDREISMCFFQLNANIFLLLITRSFSQCLHGQPLCSLCMWHTHFCFGKSTGRSQFIFRTRHVQLLPFLPLLLFSNASFPVHCDDLRCSFPDPTVTWESFSRVTCFLMFGPVSLLFIIFLPFSRSAPFFLLLLLLLSSGKAGDKNPLPHPYDHLADF